MLTKKTLSQMWDQIRMRHGIGLRAIERIPEGKLDSRPIPNMRTPKELVVHMYGTVIGAMVEGVQKGEVKEPDEEKECAQIRTRADLLTYCRECWGKADRAVQAMTDEQINATIPTSWGMDTPGFKILGAAHDEYLHHRGQLYVYLRALGQEPPMVWDFQNNAPEFQPKPQPQSAEAN